MDYTVLEKSHLHKFQLHMSALKIAVARIRKEIQDAKREFYQLVIVGMN